MVQNSDEIHCINITIQRYNSTERDTHQYKHNTVNKRLK